jgi:YgiT-type zinc finger domain-containing protein
MLQWSRILGCDLQKEKAMICSICRQGETNPGTTTVTLERGELTFVAKDVPAMVCANCGEEYLDSSTTEQVLRMAEEAAASGVQVDIRAFRAA